MYQPKFDLSLSLSLSLSLLSLKKKKAYHGLEKGFRGWTRVLKIIIVLEYTIEVIFPTAERLAKFYILLNYTASFPKPGPCLLFLYLFFLWIIVQSTYQPHLPPTDKSYLTYNYY